MRYIIFLLVILISGSLADPVHAVNTVPLSEVDVETIADSEVIGKVKKPKKMGFLKKWLIKRAVKKIKKKIEKDPDFFDRQQDLAAISLGAGIISFLLLFAGLFNPIIWIVAAILAIVGDVLSIGVLHRTKDDKETYKRQRRMATWGLIFSLLTGVLPLALFVVFLATV